MHHCSVCIICGYSIKGKFNKAFLLSSSCLKIITCRNLCNLHLADVLLNPVNELYHSDSVFYMNLFNIFYLCRILFRFFKCCWICLVKLFYIFRYVAIDCIVYLLAVKHYLLAFFKTFYIFINIIVWLYFYIICREFSSKLIIKYCFIKEKYCLIHKYNCI